jgi:hypothetical protein
MTICPIAIVAGCRKCPAFKICPLKGIIGDKPPAAASEPSARAGTKAGTKRGAGAKKPRAAAARRKK